MQPNVIFDEDSKDRDKYFLLLNRAPRMHRMAFISWLHSRNLLKDTFTSYPSEELAPYEFSKKVHLSRYFSKLSLEKLGNSLKVSVFGLIAPLKLPISYS